MDHEYSVHSQWVAPRRGRSAMAKGRPVPSRGELFSPSASSDLLPDAREQSMRHARGVLTVPRQFALEKALL